MSLKHLKRTTKYKYDLPDWKILDTFPNPGVKQVEMDCVEFTSLCPITGQPDYGTIKITYEPDELCLESKSLKLYLGSYRQYGAFAEVVTLMIYADISLALKPKFLKVESTFNYRGGISIRAIMDTYKEKHGQKNTTRL